MFLWIAVVTRLPKTTLYSVYSFGPTPLPPPYFSPLLISSQNMKPETSPLHFPLDDTFFILKEFFHSVVKCKAKFTVARPRLLSCFLAGIRPDMT